MEDDRLPLDLEYGKKYHTNTIPVERSRGWFSQYPHHPYRVGGLVPEQQRQY
ncbi:hypothetical protein SCLCIDRAFT_1223681 [Scleroderma citrinum Foug A]|uniref:Uncharacterized protein n=1 Tax=Scleroderma citrinum Foug A TaxID=1036808 RepID=A0A0C3D8M6_9AGAM|nr:hypothetical protein SCLCIDRAFT_1223681 [Scleroderma citrinum Foug A]